MTIVNIRRARLKLWLETNPVPEAEKSYFSQLVNGHAPFGEKAARRLERTYRMGDNFLDEDENSEYREKLKKDIQKKIDNMNINKLRALWVLLNP